MKPNVNFGTLLFTIIIINIIVLSFYGVFTCEQKAISKDVQYIENWYETKYDKILPEHFVIKDEHRFLFFTPDSVFFLEVYAYSSQPILLREE